MTNNILNVMNDIIGLLNLIADIRVAVGDPTGKLMQDELVEHCKKLKQENEELKRFYLKAIRNKYND